MYDGLLHLTPYRTLVARVVRALELRNGHSVLDLGCGTGNCMTEILGTARVDLIGLDASQPMLDRARRKIGDSVRLVHADALDFLEGCQHGTFDRISAINILYAVRDRSAVWRACMRALRPGGHMVAVIPDRGGRMPIIREHLQTSSLASLLRPALVGVALMDWLICALEGSPDIQFPTRQQLEEEIAESGGLVSACERCYGGAKDGVALMLVVSPAHV